MKEPEKVLHVEFRNSEDSNDADELVKWKRLCQGKFGQGGIKARTISLIKRDTIELEK